LSIATRCPRCGQEISEEPVQQTATSDPGRFRPLLAVALILLVTGTLLALLTRTSPRRQPEATVTGAVNPLAPVAIDTTRAIPGLPDSARRAGAVLRVARTWTNVRDRRSTKADVVAVLLPGDTVLADSLRSGWWRVALEGEVLGYVWAQTLE
jgi:hypothetical protein